MLSAIAILVNKEINAQIISVLKNYEIVLYFLKDQRDLLETAEDIKKKLIDYGLRENKITLNKKDKSFFQQLGYPTAYEVRYDPGVENNAADLLTTILKESNPSKQFVKRPIGSGTKNSLSIFFTE